VCSSLSETNTRRESAQVVRTFALVTSNEIIGPKNKNKGGEESFRDQVSGAQTLPSSRTTQI